MNCGYYVVNRLTAFVVRSFREAVDYIPVDERKLATMLNWMISHQARNGSFPEPGRVIHTPMQVSLHTAILASLPPPQRSLSVSCLTIRLSVCLSVCWLLSGTHCRITVLTADPPNFSALKTELSDIAYCKREHSA